MIYNPWTFSEPTEISQETDLLDYAETYLFDGYYEPPINFGIFDKATRANTYNGSGLQVKRNILMSTLETKGALSRKDLKSAVHDYLATGNCYFLIVKNLLGEISLIRHLPALYMRVGENQEKYYYLQGSFKKIEYDKSQVLHLSQIDMRQEVYGIPEWFAAVSSVLLNESATLFRRKYYKNGAHAGFLLYTNNAKMSVPEEKQIAERLNSMRGLGNFRNLFINGRGMDKTKPELIPVGQLDAKDEFLNVKNVTRDDVLSAWRVPPQLMGIMPANTGGFGDVKKSAEVFVINEILPLQDEFLTINSIVGADVISTKTYKLLEQEK